MKKLLLLLLLTTPLFAQNTTVTGGGSNTVASGTPTGACSQGDTYTDSSTDLFYYCKNGVWTATAGGSTSGTVASGTAGQPAYYPSNGTTVVGAGAGAALDFSAITSLKIGPVASTCSVTTDGYQCYDTTLHRFGTGTGSAWSAYLNQTDVGQQQPNPGITTCSAISGTCTYTNAFLSNPKTSTYQVLAADFAGCKHIPIASGTFTVTLVASGSQPAAGQCLWVENYGSGVVTIARSGQNINGGTSSLTLAAGSATAPNTAFIVSDGTNYFGSVMVGSSSSGVTSVATTSPITGGTITSTGTIACATCVVASSPGAGVAHFAGSTQTVTSSAIVGADMTNATVTATQLAAQYSKGSCTELWGGSGASFALTSGDDAIANNSCYNDSGVTRTITAVKCRSDHGTNTTTVNPTMGSAGTGTTILSGALTCGSSLAYSSSGTVSNASWTTGTGITPAMAGTLTGTSIAMIVEYTY